jgi:hypothetical protein
MILKNAIDLLLEKCKRHAQKFFALPCEEAKAIVEMQGF